MQDRHQETDLEDDEARLHLAETRLAGALRQLGALERKICERDRELRAERAMRIRYEREVQAHIAQAAALMSSTSWRVTAPLRYAVSFIRTGKPAAMGFNSRARGEKGVEADENSDVDRAGSQARKQVQDLKSRLLKLGFRDRALADFRQTINTDENPYVRALAAWELSIWAANQQSEDAARECLELLPLVEASGIAEAQVRNIAILRAECQARLGDTASAISTLERALSQQPHADLHLALVNLEPDLEAKRERVNAALGMHGLAPINFTTDQASPYDRLSATAEKTDSPVTVSVIIPAYNAAGMIETALRGLRAQTWTNLEILVSDDCSSDDTADIVLRHAQEDSRVSLIRGESNSGPYVARNAALQQARGEFVTCNDSDDWSHPEKIAIQARHLLEHPDVIANTSPQARASEELVFSRRGNSGFYIQPNMSSLMFRREQVLERIGYWDSVRFAADSEYTRRIKKVFGKSALVDVACGPVSFQRQTGGSLTGSQAFGYHGFKMGARLEYENGHRRFHESREDLFVEFPQFTRPFCAPEPMRPQRVAGAEQARHFDVIMVSDFRLPGGTNMSNIEEIKAQRRFGLKTGLVQMGRYDVSPSRPMNGRVVQQIDAESVDLITYGESASCDLLILRLPWILEEWQVYIPKINAKNIRVIVNQPPKRDYGPQSEPVYHLSRCAEHLKRYFGDVGTWHPIGPLVRDALLEHHADELKDIPLGEIWPNIIDVREWRRVMRPDRKDRKDRIRICRHSRDQYVKWPADRETLLKVYPDTERHEVHILGGGETAKRVLGRSLPKHWRVTEFGKALPQQFLAKFDVFVYFTHPDWVESFGRVIFEAMAVGLPVILPPVYKPLFGAAAIYAEPDEVQDCIDELMANDEVYDAQVRRALEYVETQFGHQVHAKRLNAAIEQDLSAWTAGGAIPSEGALTGDPARWGSFKAPLLTGAPESGSPQASLGRLLKDEADAAMERGPFSVVDKTTLPPSGDPHDYWHPAPYWHPNPDTFNGLPFIRKDGVRVSGTVMYEPESDKYDRTRLQMLFDDSTMLALAFRLTGDKAYAERAAAHLRCWFLDPASRMNPNLNYAQVKPGHNHNRGSSSGVIEMKDLYYYLDAVRMVTEAGALSQSEVEGFQAWLREYAAWLLNSDQGKGERRAGNNHGIYYDLQVAAIGAYLGERAMVRRAFSDAVLRIPEHFAPDGSQPEELTRTTTAHYCCFNYQGWANLATLGNRWGIDLWGYEAPEGQGLAKGAEWLLGHADAPWPYQQIDEFDEERFIPIWFALPEHMRPARLASIPEDAAKIKPRFYPHDGIRPYWNIVLYDRIE